MVTFNGDEPGTAAELWAADERWAALPEFSFDGFTDVVVVAPHADDESLGAGGIIAECAARGISVRVIVVTDGAASHPRAAERAPDGERVNEQHRLVQRRLVHQRLREQRRREAIAAVAILAPDAVVDFLGLPDGRVREHSVALAEQLRNILSVASTTTLVIAPWPGDGHRDHRVVGELCSAAAGLRGLRVLQYPVWLWHWGSPTDPAVPWADFVRWGLSEKARAAKRQAIAAYGSQLAPWGGLQNPVLHAQFVRNFEGPNEIFVDTLRATDHERSSAVQAGAPVSDTVGADFFDETYARHADPWGFQSRWYEARKRAITVASLPRQHYSEGLEIGCSLGLLTAALAPVVDNLVAVDIAAAAVDAARERLRPFTGVKVLQRDVLTDYPPGRFDLVVLSEVGYYFDALDLATVLNSIVASLSADATLVLCHWRHPVAEYPQRGDAVHAAARRLSGITLIASHSEDDFVLDVFSPENRSVAQQTGLVP